MPPRGGPASCAARPWPVADLSRRLLTGPPGWRSVSPVGPDRHLPSCARQACRACMERAHGQGHFTGKTSQHEGRRLTSSKISTRPYPSHGRPASGPARLMHAIGPGTRPRRWLGAPRVRERLTIGRRPRPGGSMQLHAAQPCHSAIRLALGGLRLLGRPETRPAHHSPGWLRVTVHSGSGAVFIFGPMIKCHSDSTGPLACAGSLVEAQ